MTMPQFYKQKTQRTPASDEVMRAAMNKVLKNKNSVRHVAQECEIPRSTLQRYIDKYRKDTTVTLSPNFRKRMVFSVDQESMIKDYLIDCSNRFYGLTREETRKFVYQLAIDNKIDKPKQWQEKMTAGEKWLVGFMARNPDLSLRQPEATSIARAYAFTRRNINYFFDELEKAYNKANIRGGRIYNLDESGFTTVQQLQKVISPRGQKQVGQSTSRERGELVTCVGIINAMGNKLPPVFIFPRKKLNPNFLNGAPEGSLGLTNADTGSAWMTKALFFKVIEHIIMHATPSKEDPIILVMDNHVSHLSYNVLKRAKATSIYVVTLPPHTSNKTQPLDRTVFGPMTQYFNANANSWQLSHPGQGITIYQSAELIGEAYTKACSAQNILSGFKASGIWPLDRNIFTDVDFLPATVFERETTSVEEPHQHSTTPLMAIPDPSSASTSTVQATRLENQQSRVFNKRPVEVRPLAKKIHTTPKKTNRKKTVGGFLNSTPSLKNRKPVDYPSSSDEDETMPPLDDSSADEVDEQPPEEIPEEVTAEVGKYYVVKFNTKKTQVFYVGRIIKIGPGNDVEVNFYRRGSDGVFRLPNTVDQHFVSIDDLHTMLPEPTTLSGSRTREQRGLKFDVQLGTEIR